MIPVEELLYDIDFKLNKIATNAGQNIPIEDKILALNSAQIQLIKQKVGDNNVYRLGFDSFRKRYDDLQFLVTTNKLIPTKSNKIINQYSADITKLNPKYMLYVDGFILASRGSCKNRVLHSILVKHTDVWNYISNSLTTPSFEYQETLITISDNQIDIYTDGKFEPTSLEVHYIRYPSEIDYSGYEKFDGSSSTISNSELPYYLKDELVDLTVEELAKSLDDNNRVVNTKDSISTNE